MKKLISVMSLVLVLAFAGTNWGQGTKPKDSDKQQKSYGAPKKIVEPEKKVYGSGPKNDPKIEPKKIYGSGGDKKADKIGPPPKTGPPGTKPNAKFDSSAGQQQRKEESKAKFVQATKPASTYTDPKGKVHHIDEKDVRIHNLRSQLNEERWHNRNMREQQFYLTYQSRPVVVYHDPYNSYFWYWMMDRSIEQQALWAYHHRQSMDAARYNDLMAKNADLAVRVRQLENQGAPRDPAFVPHGMTDNDLMYNKEYVQAAYNPVEEPVHHHETKEGTSVLIYLFWITIILLVIVLGIWLIFFKKWN